MNNYIKHIVEKFDFNAVNKQKKNITYKLAIDDMILNKILSIEVINCIYMIKIKY
jgi:hypothetical protein